MKKLLVMLSILALLAVLFALTLPLAAQNPNPKNLPLCADLSGQTNPIVRYEIPFGTVSSGGVYCRFLVQNGTFLVNSAEIGNADVLNLGVSQAVDVFAILGNGSAATVFNNPITVCLQGGGSMWFLDANQSPRPLVQLAATSDGSYTCGTVSTAGTVLLTNSAPAPIAPAQPVITGTPGVVITTTPGTGTSVPVVAGKLTNCRVTTTKIVRLRAEPNTTSAILSRLPYNTTWTATERVTGWVRIIFQNTQGWVSDQFVSFAGSCG